MKKNEIGFIVGLITIQDHYLVVFQPPFRGPSASVFSTLSYSSHN